VWAQAEAARERDAQEMGKRLHKMKRLHQLAMGVTNNEDGVPAPEGQQLLHAAAGGSGTVSSMLRITRSIEETRASRASTASSTSPQPRSRRGSAPAISSHARARGAMYDHLVLGDEAPPHTATGVEVPKRRHSSTATMIASLSPPQPRRRGSLS
jgi:hypothetical protein